MSPNQQQTRVGGEQDTHASVVPALLGLLFLLLLLSLAGCSDLPSLVQRELGASDAVLHTSVSPVTASKVALAAPVEPTDRRSVLSRGVPPTVDTATGTNVDDATDNHGMATGDADQGSVAAEDPVRVVGLETPFGQAHLQDPESRATRGVGEGEELKAQGGAGAAVHALVARDSFHEASATLESN